MPGPFLASFYFNTDDAEGWSENVILQDTDIDSAAAEAASYIGTRMACSPSNCHMVYAKVSDVTIKGDSEIAVPTGQHFPFQGTYVETPTGAFLEANTALLIKVVATAAKVNRFFLRGLSLDVVTGRTFLAPAGFVTALNALLTWHRTHTQVRTADKPLTHPPTYTYAAATDAFFVRVTARKPGRPFSAVRGRKFAHRTLALASAGKSSTASAPATQQPPGSRRGQHP